MLACSLTSAVRLGPSASSLSSTALTSAFVHLGVTSSGTAAAFLPFTCSSAGHTLRHDIGHGPCGSPPPAQLQPSGPSPTAQMHTCSDLTSALVCFGGHFIWHSCGALALPLQLRRTQAQMWTRLGQCRLHLQHKISRAVFESRPLYHHRIILVDHMQVRRTLAQT